MASAPIPSVLHDDDAVRIWEPRTGHLNHVLAGCSGQAVLATAPDGSWIVVADSPRKSGREIGRVRLLDTGTGAERNLPVGHQAGVSALAVAPDGRWLASGDAPDRWGLAARTGRVTVPGGEVRIWDFGTGRVRHILTGHSGPITKLAAAPDGSWLASGCGVRTSPGEGPYLGPEHRRVARRADGAHGTGVGTGSGSGRHLARLGEQ